MEKKIANYQHILVETEVSIAYVTMNRPNKRNALSVDHYERAN